jgi:small-conductance mechanosensitive channel
MGPLPVAEAGGAVSEITIKAIASGGVVVGLFLLRWLTLRVVHRYVEETEVWFRARRVATYLMTFVDVITLAWIWVDAFSAFPTYIGLVSAGVAIALADVLKNMAGWLYILARRPFRLGDRIEIEGTRGDVIDIRLFRFTLMEIGNWVDADQSTGRLIHVPNGVVFTRPVANYTEGFEYIWHEIPVLLTFESNWEKAKAIFLEEVGVASVDPNGDAARRLRETAGAYQIKVGTLTPTVYLTVRDSGVLLTGRLLVAARERRGVEGRVWEALLRRFGAAPDIDLAYPTMRAYFQGTVPPGLRQGQGGEQPTSGN